MTGKSDKAEIDAGNRVTLGLATLSFAAGSMDAIAFFALGGVFTSAMSGNTIVLGLAIGRGHFGLVLHALAALAGYLAGVAAASASLIKFGRGKGWTLALEALFLIAFAGLWFAVGDQPTGPAVFGLILLSAIAMGLQGGIARVIGAPGIMTVIFTSTYTTLVGNFVERSLMGERPRWTAAAARQSTALAAYFGGAVAAAIVTAQLRLLAPILPLGAILLVLAGLRLRRIDFGQRETHRRARP